MPDQAHHLRNLVRAAVAADATLAPGGPALVLSGAQPRIGATTTACGLAQELARLGKQVILVDANLQSPAVAAHLFSAHHPLLTSENSKLETRNSKLPRGTFADILSGARRASEVLLPTAEEGLRIIPGCPRDAQPPLNAAAADRLTAELTVLSRQVDVLLIDAGHGMNAWTDRLWQLAVEVLILSRPTGQGLVDAYTAAKVSQYQLHDNKLRLVLTAAKSNDQSATLAAKFTETCDQFLSLKTKTAATVPAPPSAPGPQRQPGSPGPSEHARALRLLAADLTAEFRATSLRLIRPNRVQSRTATTTPNFLTQRR